MYLGPPGAVQLVADPEQNLPVRRSRVRGTHQLLGGGAVVDQALRTLREWHLTWNIMTETEYDVLRSLQEQMYGKFPYVFFDPNEKNLFSPNISTASDVTKDTTGFSLLGSGNSLASAATVTPLQGVRHLTLVTAATGAAGTQGAQFGISSTVLPRGNAVPVVPGLDYSFRAYIWTPDGTPQTFRAALRWFSTADSLISSSTGPIVTPGANWTTAATATATAPAGAAYLVPQVRNAATLTAAATLYIDQPLLVQGSVLPSWQMGLGVPYVGPFDIEDRYPWIDWHGPVDITLQEL
jgi:hypothetical protein